jgi:aminopeptidase
MLMSVDPTNFARLLCGYCLEVQPGQQVLVHSTTLAEALLLALQRELLAREAWPLLRTELPGERAGFWAAARERQLDAFAEATLLESESADCSLAIQAPANTRELAGVDPARMARAGTHPRGAPALALVEHALVDARPCAAGRDERRRLRRLRARRALPRSR